MNTALAAAHLAAVTLLSSMTHDLAQPCFALTSAHLQDFSRQMTELAERAGESCSLGVLSVPYASPRWSQVAAMSPQDVVHELMEQICDRGATAVDHLWPVLPSLTLIESRLRQMLPDRVHVLRRMLRDGPWPGQGAQVTAPLNFPPLPSCQADPSTTLSRQNATAATTAIYDGIARNGCHQAPLAPQQLLSPTSDSPSQATSSRQNGFVTDSCTPSRHADADLVITVPTVDKATPVRLGLASQGEVRHIRTPRRDSWGTDSDHSAGSSKTTDRPLVSDIDAKIAVLSNWGQPLPQLPTKTIHESSLHKVPQAPKKRPSWPLLNKTVTIPQKQSSKLSLAHPADHSSASSDTLCLESGDCSSSSGKRIRDCQLKPAGYIRLNPVNSQGSAHCDIDSCSSLLVGNRSPSSPYSQRPCAVETKSPATPHTWSPSVPQSKFSDSPQPISMAQSHCTAAPQTLSLSAPQTQSPSASEAQSPAAAQACFSSVPQAQFHSAPQKPVPQSKSTDAEQMPKPPQGQSQPQSQLQMWPLVRKYRVPEPLKGPHSPKQGVFSSAPGRIAQGCNTAPSRHDQSPAASPVASLATDQSQAASSHAQKQQPAVSRSTISVSAQAPRQPSQRLSPAVISSPVFRSATAPASILPQVASESPLQSQHQVDNLAQPQTPPQSHALRQVQSHGPNCKLLAEPAADHLRIKAGNFAASKWIMEQDVGTISGSDSKLDVWQTPHVPSKWCAQGRV